MVTINQIIQYYKSKGYDIIPALDDFVEQRIIGPRAIEIAGVEHISFISNKLAGSFLDLIQNSFCRVILIEDILLRKFPDFKLPSNRFYIVCSNPKKEIIDFSNQFLSKSRVKLTSIHSSAVIAENVIIGDNVEIGPFVTVEENCIIGSRCVIGAGTVIKSQTFIGNDVLIGSCNVIGGDGFGYVKNEETGAYDQFPHFGGVKIMNNVHIGSNTCIDRGSLKDTIIGEGVRIDNLVHIAHNVEIGRNSIVIACSMIAGSVVIEDNCWIAPSSSVRNGITVYQGATVGLGSTVTKNVEKNQTVMGNPAMPIDDFQILREQQKQALVNHKKSC